MQQPLSGRCARPWRKRPAVPLTPGPRRPPPLQVYRALHDEGLGDKDFSAVYRYRYGSGCDNPEWKEGQQLYSAQIP